MAYLDWSMFEFKDLTARAGVDLFLEKTAAE